MESLMPSRFFRRNSVPAMLKIVCIVWLSKKSRDRRDKETCHKFDNAAKKRPKKRNREEKDLEKELRL